MQKKKVEIESKKDAKKDRKYPSSMEKIADMPLIASAANLISVVQRNESDEARGDRASSASPNNIQPANLPDTGKSEKKGGQNAATKSNEREQTSQKLGYDFAKIGAKRGGEGASETSRMEKGVELTLTPLAKNEAEDAAESDRSVIGKEANKIAASTNDDDRKTTALSKEEGLGGRNTEAEKKRRKKLEESRESVGEPDGREDEREAIEPPALPKSPPPVESARPSTLQDTFKPPIITEPRPSFLHGAVINSEAKVKPAVPQKPTNFSAKNNHPPDGKKSCALPLSSPVQQGFSGLSSAGKNSSSSRLIHSFDCREISRRGKI